MLMVHDLPGASRNRRVFQGSTAGLEPKPYLRFDKFDTMGQFYPFELAGIAVNRAGLATYQIEYSYTA